MKKLVKQDISTIKPDKEREELKKVIFNFIKMNSNATLNEIFDNCTCNHYECEFLIAMVELFLEDALDSADGCYFLYRPVWEKYD